MNPRECEEGIAQTKWRRSPRFVTRATGTRPVRVVVAVVTAAALLIAASRTAAPANVRDATSAADPKRCGCSTVGLLRHHDHDRGCLVASISSKVIVSWR